MATQKGPYFIVNNPTDLGDGVCDAAGTGDGCTLREAVVAADAATLGAYQTPYIYFDQTVFASPKIITLSGTELLINRDMQIAGTGSRLITVSANNKSRVLTVSQGTVSISGLTLSDGLYDFKSSNLSYGGGAIISYGNLTLTDSVISNCHTIGRGAYVTALGGGIFTGGHLTVNNCTFSGNSTTYTDSFYGNAMGGAIGNNNVGVASITNSTFVGNSAIWQGTRTGGAQGGAIGSQGKLTMTSSTLSGNSISGDSGGNSGGADIAGLTTVRNCILNSQSIGITVGDGGYNLGRDKINTDLRLDPRGLQNNGGSMDTIALLPGSPAIDAGDPALNTAGAGFDQRGTGFPRVKYGRIDIGAFEVQNVPPIMASVTLSPTNPKTNDTLTATPSASDADGDTLTYSYLWKKNGAVIAGESASSLDLSKLGNGDKGDQITVSVTASDSGSTSPSLTSDAVTVQNSAPLVSGVSIDQASPKTNQTLSFSVGTLTDADGDTLTPSYQWKKNGQALVGQTGATLDLSVAGNGDKGDIISVVVMTSDGTASASSESPAITVANTPFSFTSLSITPSSPRRQDILRAVPVTSDPDGDPVTFSYRWKKNDNVIAGQTSQTLNLLSTGIGLKGNRFSCVVAAGGEWDGVSLNPREVYVIIQNSPPVVSGVTLPTTSRTTDILSAQIQASDVDHDPLTATYQWKKNGEVIAGQTGATLDLGVPGNGDRGDAISVIVTESDGTASDSKESNATTIVNRAPDVTTISIDNQSPTSNKTLTAVISATDADGDDVTLAIAWKKNGEVIEGETSSTLDLSKAG